VRPAVTLAVPCKNAAPTLHAVLDAGERLAPDELFVVDDGSTDETAAIARRHGARVLSHGKNRGLAAARNTALARARTELVVFVDGDAVPDPDLLSRLAAGYDDPRLAAVGGQVMEHAESGALPDRWRALFWRQTQGAAPLDDAPFVVGACCSLRRQAALEVGGFSTRFRENGEDVELCARLRQHGYRLAYDPDARVFHQRRDDVASLVRMVFRHSRDHVLALRFTGQSPALVVRNAVRWGPVTLVSSLRRHRSPGLAALSPLCHAASLLGCAAGLIRRV
jgi:GT2 family glycosyltransferase